MARPDSSPQTNPQSAIEARFGLAGRNAFVTGGSTGIGREVVIGLGDMGVDSVGFSSTWNSRDAARDLVRSEKEKGRKVFWVPGDIGKRKIVDKILQRAQSEHGITHILICAAGFTDDQAFMKLTDADFDRMRRVKTDSARRLMQGMLPGMRRARFGRGVVISSVAGDGSPWQWQYAEENEATVGLAKSAALVAPERNVTFNIVKPALVDTKMTTEDKLPEAGRKGLIELMPIGRSLKPVEVADAVLMLVAQRTAAINAHELYVDGAMRRV